MACAIWSAKMTSKNQYSIFMVSRFIGGIFGATPQILGNGIIMDMFFVHERGRAFTLYSTIFMWGSAAAPTFGDFIVERVGWPGEYWWTIGLQGAMTIITFLFLEETRFNRDAEKGASRVYTPTSWLDARISTLLLGSKFVRSESFGDIVGYCAMKH